MNFLCHAPKAKMFNLDLEYIILFSHLEPIKVVIVFVVLRKKSIDEIVAETKP